MAHLIDRRSDSRNRSTVNRQRFLRRYRKHIQKAVSDAVGRRSITDVEQGERITIPRDRLTEPSFGHGQSGRREQVVPGNREFVAGDRIRRPSGGRGDGQGTEASDSGEGMDDFVFQITQREFLDFMFQDLELPNLVQRQLAGSDSFRTRRAGYTTVGTPSKINIVRSLRAAQSRRIALGSGKRARLRALNEELEALLSAAPAERDRRRIDALLEDIAELRRQLDRLPFIDQFDIRYNLSVREPRPSSKAVMFCIMDISGSMDQATKEIAKRFFILLYLFLQRNYDHTEVVFLRHHTSAQEVNEEEFFYARDTGGTIVSSALHLMRDIIAERYPASEWNLYAAQASDGDNWRADSSVCRDLMVSDIMPQMQYYAYVEITSRGHQSLWHEYESVQAAFEDRFAMRQIVEVGDIYPVFRDLFQRKPA